MKIGILSMQKVKNYGSFLQAFALKKTIESFGHEVAFIDILPGIQLQEYKKHFNPFYQSIRGVYYSLFFYKSKKYQKKYELSFESFLEELGVNKHNFNIYDGVLIGSDEVFNIAQVSSWGYSSQLFGDIPNTKNIISYAGSFGQTSLEFIQKNNLVEDVSKAMKNMTAISVRDNNSKEIVENLLSITPEINIDPVLFFDFSKNIKETPGCNYILIYSYPNRIKDKKIVNAIKAFAKKSRKKIFSIFSFYEWADSVLLPHPFEVLSYFKNADYVITDTFHGAIMSIKFNKQFAALIRDSNRNKLLYLLKSLKLDTQIVEHFYEIEKVVTQQINYSETNIIIKNETQKSLEYLQEHFTKD